MNPRFIVHTRPVDIYDASFGKPMFVRTRYDWMVYDLLAKRIVKKYRILGHWRATRLARRMNEMYPE